MKKYIFLFVLVVWGSHLPVMSQTENKYTWWDPAAEKMPVIDGRAWHDSLVRLYDRLPARAEKLVRKEVWSLSQNTAGEYIRFVTDASEITVRYTVSGTRSMNHMPATGVSGVDLYVQDVKNNWHWARGGYSFGDTIVYTFSNIALPAAVKEFRLYLPLYNTVKWMQIGVPVAKAFRPLAVSKEAPLVMYGTSIMQGACASRPGLAWTNILGRKLNKPVINLGFSGNGRLEQPLIALITETAAQLFVLDCQPNLTDPNVYSENEIRQRIINSVQAIRAKHAKTPILLVEHCCGLPAVTTDSTLVSRYGWTSNILASTYTQLKKEGMHDIYLLTAKDIGFDSESTVDGTHPTDIGMMKYAGAYEKKIRQILKL